MEPLRRVISALAVLGAVAGCIIWLAPGCKEDVTQALDTAVARDVGQGNCADAAPNSWRVEDIGAAATVDAGGSKLTTFNSIWGVSEQEIFAVGRHGRIVRYDGVAWKTQQSKTSEHLTAVWGTSPKDVWAVGYNMTVLHYDGNQWQPMPVPIAAVKNFDGGGPDATAGLLKQNLWGVWSGGKLVSDAVWAVGDNGTVLHFDPKSKIWTGKIKVTAAGSATEIQDQLNDVWGASPTKVYIVGHFGTILTGSKNGLAKMAIDPGTTKDLIGVWGRRSSEIYAVGTGGTVLQLRGGSTWKGIKGAPKQVLRAIWGPSNTNAVTYIAGWDGTLLRMSGGPGFAKGAKFDPFYCIVPNTRLEDVWGTLVPGQVPEAGLGPDAGPVPDAGLPPVPSAWVVGAAGTILHGP